MGKNKTVVYIPSIIVSNIQETSHLAVKFISLHNVGSRKKQSCGRSIQIGYSGGHVKPEVDDTL